MVALFLMPEWSLSFIHAAIDGAHLWVPGCRLDFRNDPLTEGGDLRFGLWHEHLQAAVNRAAVRNLCEAKRLTQVFICGQQPMQFAFFERA